MRRYRTRTRKPWRRTSRAAPPQGFVASSQQDEQDATVEAPEPPPVDDLDDIDDPPLVLDDDEPPFDPPDEDDDIFGNGPYRLDSVDDAPPLAAQPAEPRDSQRGALLPAPPIWIHASCDRPESLALAETLPSDPRMARVRVTTEMGGLDAALSRFGREAAPDLLIVDTALDMPGLLRRVDDLAALARGGVHVFIIGDVNDVGLMRQLAGRGLRHYLLAPPDRDEVIDQVCALYAAADRSRVIAVIGARGGVGASTLAHNIAWSIAERQAFTTTLIDLDLCFSATAFTVDAVSGQAIADMLTAPEHMDTEALEQRMHRQSARLQVITAPAAIGEPLDVHPQALDTIIQHVRRSSAFVVLDLPHHWAPWVRETLIGVDEVVVVATPDLASLRNTKNIVEALWNYRARAPLLALSMVGVPKKPEVAIKEFAETVAVEPTQIIGFEPTLFASGMVHRLMIGEAAPNSPIAAAIDDLATAITGRRPIAQALPAEAVKKPKIEAAAVPESTPLAESKPQKRIKAAKSEKPPKANRAGPAEPQPFTFAPPSEKPAAAQPPAQPDDALLLVDAIPDPALARARDAAGRRQRARRPQQIAQRRRGRPGTVRAAVAILTLILAGLWYAQSGINAAAPPISAAAPQAPTPDLAAQYESALTLLRNGAPNQGARQLHDLAQAGLAIAQYRLGQCYERGEGVPQDLVVARRWTARAASLGHPPAMHDLGVFFARAEGGEGDDAMAFRWFRQAAEYNVAASQYNLGVLYEQGRGVNADIAESLFWFLVAARAGDDDAVARAAELEPRLSLPQIEQARARAEAFRPRR